MFRESSLLLSFTDPNLDVLIRFSLHFNLIMFMVEAQNARTRCLTLRGELSAGHRVFCSRVSAGNSCQNSGSNVVSQDRMNVWSAVLMNLKMMENANDLYMSNKDMVNLKNGFTIRFWGSLDSMIHRSKGKSVPFTYQPTPCSTSWVKTVILQNAWTPLKSINPRQGACLYR